MSDGGQRAGTAPTPWPSERARAEPRAPTGSAGGGHRLRRPVLAADRAAGAGVRGVLGTGAPPRAAAGDRGAQPRGIILSGGPASVYAPDAPRLERGLLELGVPVLGICYGMQLLVHELGGRVEQAEVGEFGRSDLTVDEHGRAAARNCRASRPAGCPTATPSSRRRPGSRRSRTPPPPRWRRSRASSGASTASSSTPRSSTPPTARQILERFLDRGVRLPPDVVGGVDRRGADRAHPRAGGGGEGDLRPLRRRRLLGGGAAGAPRRGRPADLRVRRPRPDAQGRGRAGDRHLPRHLQGAAGGG